MDDLEALLRVESAFPGALRDQLVAAILDGRKTSTTSLVVEDEIENEPFPQVGAWQLVVDSSGDPVAVIETADVQQVALPAVPREHVRDEGEGYSSVQEWRAGHERFWNSADMRDYLDDPSFTVCDETLVVLERFRLVKAL